MTRRREPFEPAGPPPDPLRFPALAAVVAVRRAVRAGGPPPEPVPPPAGHDFLDELARLFVEDNPGLSYERAYEMARFA